MRNLYLRRLIPKNIILLHTHLRHSLTATLMHQWIWPQTWVCMLLMLYIVLWVPLYMMFLVMMAVVLNVMRLLRRMRLVLHVSMPFIRLLMIAGMIHSL